MRSLAVIGLSRQELRDVAGLSGILMLRLLGLFLLLPVLSVYALGLDGATPLLAGLAVGAYGLSQTLLQIPMGLLSDRFGRRPVVAAGQIVYALGCVWAALSTGIGGLIGGRLLQGAGATASVVIAYIADVTRDEVRGRAMAFAGISIGASFALGFLLGPPLSALWGVRSLFWIIAALDIAALLYMYVGLPAPPRPKPGQVSWANARRVASDGDLVRLDGLMFMLHLGLTAVFVATPVLLQERWPRHEIWKVYVPMMLGGGLIMLPAMAYAEIKKKLRELIAVGIAVAYAGLVMMASSSENPTLLVAGLGVYFVGFNLIEPALPSLTSRMAPKALRGTSMGLFNMSQFLGAFCGGTLGGFFLGFRPRGLYVALAVLCIPWALILLGLGDPDRGAAPASRD